MALDIAIVQIGQPSLFFRVIQDPTFLLALQLIFTLYSVLVVVGLWRLKRWAWFLTMVQLGLSMAFELWFYTIDTPIYHRMVIDVIMVFYLNQHDVQQAFKQSRKPQEAAV
jgi:uncharacterized membrane protein (DUF2068 family)